MLSTFQEPCEKSRFFLDVVSWK